MCINTLNEIKIKGKAGLKKKRKTFIQELLMFFFILLGATPRFICLLSNC